MTVRQFLGLPAATLAAVTVLGACAADIDPSADLAGEPTALTAEQLTAAHRYRTTAPAEHTWEVLPRVPLGANAVDVAATSTGCFAADSAGRLWEFVNGSGWHYAGIADVANVAVNGDDLPWVSKKDGSVFEYTRETGWTPRKGRLADNFLAGDIGVDRANNAWALSKNSGQLAHYLPLEGRWQLEVGHADRLGVGYDAQHATSSIYLVDDTHIFESDGFGNWTPVFGGAFDFAVGLDGSVWSTGIKVYWRGGENDSPIGKEYASPPTAHGPDDMRMRQISVDNVGYPYVVDLDGDVYRMRHF